MDDKKYYSKVTLVFSLLFFSADILLHFWPPFEYVLHIKLFWADSYLIVSSNYFWIFHYQNLCDGYKSRVQIRYATSTRKFFFCKSRSHWLANEENLTFLCLKMTLNGFSFIEIKRIVFFTVFLYIWIYRFLIRYFCKTHKLEFVATC